VLTLFSLLECLISEQILIMKIAFLLTLLCFGAVNFVVSAQQLNNYKYISVPNQFEFQKETNSYEINALTKFLFNKYQFEAFLESDNKDNTIPVCEVLRAYMEKESGFLDTKIKVVLKDCNGQVVYASAQGKSIKKDYKQAYHDAIRKALNDPIIKNHKYIPSKNVKMNTPVAKKQDLVNKPKPIGSITDMPKKKETVENSVLKTAPKLLFRLREKQYTFQKNEKGYLIFEEEAPIGKAILLPNNKDYKVEAGTLSGKASFDDYGNFVLERINPVNNKPITDIMAREN